MSDVATIAVYDLDRHKKRLELKMPSADGNAVEIVSLDFSHDGKHLLAQGGAPTWTCMLWWWEKNKPLAQHANVSGDPNRPSTQANLQHIVQITCVYRGACVTAGFAFESLHFAAQPLFVSDAVRNATFHPLDQTLVCCSGNGVVKFFRIQDNLFRAQTNSLVRSSEWFLLHAYQRLYILSYESSPSMIAAYTLFRLSANLRIFCRTLFYVTKKR